MELDWSHLTTPSPGLITSFMTHIVAHHFHSLKINVTMAHDRRARLIALPGHHDYLFDFLNKYYSTGPALDN